MEQGRESSADPGPLAERIAQLEALVSQQQAAIAAYQEQLERQHEQLVLLKRALFSSRRERYLPSPDQRLLFSSPPAELPAGDEDATADSGGEEPPPAPAARPRRRGKKFVFPEGLPSRRIECPLPTDELACACCHEPRVVISEQVTKQLELEPAQAYVVEYVRYTYACPRCRSGDQMQTSAKPPVPIEKSPFGPSVLATIAVYKYARHMSLYREQEHLAGYQGYLQSDGYSVYESLVREGAKRLVHVACWAHTRRKFDEALCTTSHPLLHEALAAIGQLYDVEDRAAALTHEERRAMRQAESRPIVDRLNERLIASRKALRPSSKLGEAVEYALARWPSLLRYLDDGHLAIDTNHLERQFRPIAVGRANWLFLGRETAGPTAAILYTVIQSARLNEVDVLPYLTDVLRHLPAVAAGDTAGIDQFLPDRWLAAHPQYRLVERQRESRQVQTRRKARRAANQGLAASNG